MNPLSRFGLDRRTSDATHGRRHSLSQDTIVLSETTSERSDSTGTPSIELRDGTDGMTVAPPAQETGRELRIYRVPLTPALARAKRSGLVQFLLIADLLCCLLTVSIARSVGSSMRPDLLVLFVATVAIWWSAFGLFGLYRASRSSEQVRLLVGGVAIGVFGIDLLVAAKSFSGPRLAVLVVCGWTLEVTARGLVRAHAGRIRLGFKASDEHVRALLDGLGHAELQVAGFIATECQTGQIVAFDE